MGEERPAPPSPRSSRFESSKGIPHALNLLGPEIVQCRRGRNPGKRRYLWNEKRTVSTADSGRHLVRMRDADGPEGDGRDGHRRRWRGDHRLPGRRRDGPARRRRHRHAGRRIDRSGSRTIPGQGGPDDDGEHGPAVPGIQSIPTFVRMEESRQRPFRDDHADPDLQGTGRSVLPGVHADRH